MIMSFEPRSTIQKHWKVGGGHTCSGLRDRTRTCEVAWRLVYTEARRVYRQTAAFKHSPEVAYNGHGPKHACGDSFSFSVSHVATTNRLSVDYATHALILAPWDTTVHPFSRAMILLEC